jgi:arylformamidase
MPRIVHDLTYRIEPGMLLYPGDQPPCVRRLSAAAGLTASEITLGCHAGTHVDAPAHFIQGAAMVEDLEMQHFYGPSLVMRIDQLDTATAAARGRHVLLISGRQLHAGVELAAVEWLLDAHPLSVGCDAYSLDAPGDSWPAHLAVARRGLPAFVRLDLDGVEPGEYWFSALPLKVAGVEGIPVRAVLLRQPI